MSDRPGIPYGYNPERGTFATYVDNRHLLTFGPTRSGKNATVIIQALLLSEHSVICIDSKGQNAAITVRRRRELGEVFVVNPFRLHAGKPWNLPSHRFNPLAHLRIDDENVVGEVASIAEALITTEGKEPYFDNTARDLVKLLMLHQIATEGGKATLPEVRRQLTLLAEPLTDNRPLAELIYALLHSPHAFVRQPAGRFFKDSRDILSAINTAITQTSFLDDPAIAHTLSGSDVTVSDFKKHTTTLYIILPARFLIAYFRFFRLLVVSALDQLMARPGGHPTLFLLDEFASLQHLPAVENAFSQAAGFNVQLWPFLQDLPQLKDVYERRWQTFIANAGLVQFFTPADMDTAEFIQRRGGYTTGISKSGSFREIGKREMLDGGSGITESFAETRVPLLPVEQMMGIGSTRQILFFGGVHGAFKDVYRLPYWEIPRLAGMYDPDPFHL